MYDDTVPLPTCDRRAISSLDWKRSVVNPLTITARSLLPRFDLVAAASVAMLVVSLLADQFGHEPRRMPRVAPIVPPRVDAGRMWHDGCDAAAVQSPLKPVGLAEAERLGHAPAQEHDEAAAKVELLRRRPRLLHVPRRALRRRRPRPFDQQVDGLDAAVKLLDVDADEVGQHLAAAAAQHGAGDAAGRLADHQGPQVRRGLLRDFRGFVGDLHGS